MMTVAQTNATDDWVELQPVTPARVQVDKNFKIPLIIHQAHTPHKLPRPLADCIQSWIDLNPEFEHRYYDGRAQADYVHRYGSPEYIRAFDFIAGLHPTATGAIKADLFRLLLLSREGGVWVDADHLARNPIMKILKPYDQYICGVRRRLGMVIVGFAIIISAPGHPFITAAMDNIIAAKVYKKRLGLRKYKRLWNHYTGPGPFSDAVASLMPSPHPRVAGIHALAEHPDFTYTVLLEDALGGSRHPQLYLGEHMNALNLKALKTMGIEHYSRECLLWSRRERALNLIVHPSAIWGMAIRGVKKSARIFTRK